ncbi:hypothetical protein OU5_P0308 (plasmid) [Pseudomonas mandelii JR-1]|jgi:hypothetical protein|uniref:Uncharacterized protein n=1 Tax=Pseudomonas mandelii JR-1 TaxID=1147786 RepID=A0A024ELU2_9PSED|nr:MULTISPECIES: hypothetical protein [Pseudomonas]AHZ73560.1 hypothetical protein OU5_P0308 [Pseudomonas mandelii JR-1]
MPLKALQAMWPIELPRLSERVQTSWFSQLNHIHGEKTEGGVRDAVLLAQGFVVALLEAELIEEPGAHLLGTTLLRVQNDAIARLHAANIVGQTATEVFLNKVQPSLSDQFTIIRGGLEGNRKATLQEVHDFLDACGLSPESAQWEGAMAGVPIEVDGTTIRFVRVT